MSHRPTSQVTARKASRTPRTKSIDEVEDPSKIADMLDRRRMQNRISQRNYRNKIRTKLEKLEALLGPEAAAELDNPNSTMESIVARSRGSISIDSTGLSSQPSITPPLRRLSYPLQDPLAHQQQQTLHQLRHTSPYECKPDPDADEVSPMSQQAHLRRSSMVPIPMDMSGLDASAPNDMLPDLNSFSQLDAPLESDWASLLQGTSTPPPPVEELAPDETEASSNSDAAGVGATPSSPMPFLYPDQFAAYAWPGFSPMTYGPGLVAAVPSVRSTQTSSWPSSSGGSAGDGSTPSASSSVSDASSPRPQPVEQHQQPQCHQHQLQSQQQTPESSISPLSSPSKSPQHPQLHHRSGPQYLQATHPQDMPQAWLHHPQHPGLQRLHSAPMNVPMHQPMMFMMVPVPPPAVAQMSGNASTQGSAGNMGPRGAPGSRQMSPVDRRSWGLYSGST